MKKLDGAIRERWNKMVEEEYQKHVKDKEQEKVKKNIIEKEKSKTRILDKKEKDKDPKKDLVEEYKILQKEFVKIDDDETTKKWKVLSKAYKLGKEIYGQEFSVLKLSQHFDIPYTTTKRVLSLDKANERTWELIEEGQISAFKVAQICMTKNVKYQDEIVDLVMADNLSTVQIKNIRVKNGEVDVKTFRLNEAVKKGFARKQTAYKSIKDTTQRMMKLLDIEKRHIPESKVSDVIEMLDELQTKIHKRLEDFTDRK